MSAAVSTGLSAGRRTATVLLGALLFTGLLSGVPAQHLADQATAATTAKPATKTSVKQRIHAMRVALAQRGDPYKYGAEGPKAFDCSGLTMYSYKKSGRSIPRTSDQQKAGLRAIAKADKARGDIIVFVNNGDAYHVGIYVGHNKIVHASKPGTPVKVDRIWTSSYVVRRP